VVLRALRPSAGVQKDGFAPIAVIGNLSMRQFRQEALANAIDDALRPKRAGAALARDGADRKPDHARHQVAIRILCACANRRRYSVDDFGTGIRAFPYLTKLPIHALKIDQSSSRTSKGAAGGRSLAHRHIRSRANLQLKVVGEGVETAAQFEFLKKHDCDEAQGFHLAKPVTCIQGSSAVRCIYTAVASAPTPSAS